MQLFRILLPIVISLAATALLAILQVYRFTQLSRHPWRDIFSHKWTLIFYVILRILTIFALVRSIFLRSFESTLYCALALVLFEAPMWVSRKLKMEFSPVMEVIVLLFIYAAEILGEVNHYYVLVPGWDTALHTINGFLCAAIGFCLVDMLNRSEQVELKLSPAYLAMVAFCFSMTIGVLWEFFEYTADRLMQMDMQKDFLVQRFSTVFPGIATSSLSNIVRTQITLADGRIVTVEGGYLDIGINDTMKDLMVNALGALAFSIIGFFASRSGITAKLARAFIPSVKKAGDILDQEG